MTLQPEVTRYNRGGSAVIGLDAATGNQYIGILGKGRVQQ